MNTPAGSLNSPIQIVKAALRAHGCAAHPRAVTRDMGRHRRALARIPPWPHLNPSTHEHRRLR
jgi:hypothetical protein